MIEPGNRNSSMASASRGVALAVISGLTAGLVAALLDLRQAQPELDSASSTALMLLQTTGRLPLAAGLLGLVASLLAVAGGKLASKAGRSLLNGSSLVLTIVMTPFLVYVSIRLFQGGVTSQLPARPALIAATSIAFAAVTWISTRVTLGLLARLDARGRIGPVAIVGGSALIGIALGARWCDAHMYRRLYLYLHVLLAFATLGGLALAARILLLRAVGGVTAIRIGAIGLSIAALLAALAGMTAESRQTVKVAMYDRTATTSNVLLLTSGPRKVGQGPRPSQDVRKKRYERERLARTAALEGDYPAFPGAHLILITVDAMRADKLGTYGYTERDLSPNIDEWAKGATVFDRAYCTAPHSSYSISSFHTSHYLHDEAMLGQEISHPTIAQILSEEGYETSGLYTQGIFFTEGDMVAHYRTNKFGFDTASHGAPPPKVLTDNAIAEIDRFVAKGEPAFFLWVHYFNVHEPYKSTRFGTSPRDRYEGEITVADVEIRRLLDYIESKLARDTVVVLSADHGEEFKEHGGHYHGSTLYEEQIRVPLIIKAPKGIPGRVETPVSLVDLAPTVLGLLGSPPRPDMAGQDLRAGIFGRQEDMVPRPVFSSVMHRHMAIDWPWKLISDPSRGLYELYDLQKDPTETINIYDNHKGRSQELLQETYAWLDAIGKGTDPAQTALNLGRMRDKRAIPGLLDVAENTGAPEADRVEALGLLAAIKAWGERDRLAPLLEDPDIMVATQAALALASIEEEMGRSVLQDALYDDDAATRDGAALALGKLKDTAAVPALIDALGRVDLKVREEAIRLLGDLGDPRATEPLIETISEDRTRYLTVLALGKIGDPRAYDTLMDVLEHESHTDIRGYTVVALGWMEMDSAVPRLLRVLREEPELKWTPEALVRLGAIESGVVFGTDLSADSAARKTGWEKCVTKERVIPGEFLGRTVCASTGPKATLEFSTDVQGEAMVLVRGRHLLSEKEARVDLAVEVDGALLETVTLTSEHTDFRVDAAAGVWKPGPHTVHLSMKGKGRFELDHLLVVAKN